MRVGQTGVARNGQRGIITEVYTNAVRFLSITGAYFTLLNDEFTPATATRAERAKIAKRADALFGKIGANDGFHFGIRRRKTGAVEAFVKRIPGYVGVPKLEVNV